MCLLKQDYPDYDEVLAVDDCSTDSYVRIVIEFAERFKKKALTLFLSVDQSMVDFVLR